MQGRLIVVQESSTGGNDMVIMKFPRTPSHHCNCPGLQVNSSNCTVFLRTIYISRVPVWYHSLQLLDDGLGIF